MNTFFGVLVLLTANLMLVAPFQNRTVASFQNRTVASFQNRTVFRKSDIFDQVDLPQLPTVNLTMPGTKWCGIGNSAADYNDLGEFNKTDICCRAHHACEDSIEPIGSSHSLHNPSLLPRFNCKCEQKLFKCLKDLGDVPSAIFGETYFGLVEQCFAKDFPAVECVKYQTGLLGIGKRCKVYKFDESKNQTYQFFDLPFFFE